MLTGLFAFAGIFLSFLVLTNADGEQFCDNFGWTKMDANCFRPFLYYVDGDQAKQLCAKVGGDMVSFIEEASPEYTNLVVDELNVAQELQLGMPGKKNGVLCKKPASNGQNNELFDKICPDLATKWPVPTKSERPSVPVAQLVKKSDGLENTFSSGPSASSAASLKAKKSSSASSNIMGKVVHSARLSASLGGHSNSKAEASHSASYVHEISHSLDHKA